MCQATLTPGQGKIDIRSVGQTWDLSHDLLHVSGGWDRGSGVTTSFASSPAFLHLWSHIRLADDTVEMVPSLSVLTLALLAPLLVIGCLDPSTNPCHYTSGKTVGDCTDIAGTDRMTVSDQPLVLLGGGAAPKPYTTLASMTNNCVCSRVRSSGGINYSYSLLSQTRWATRCAGPRHDVGGFAYWWDGQEARTSGFGGRGYAQKYLPFNWVSCDGIAISDLKPIYSVSWVDPQARLEAPLPSGVVANNAANCRGAFVDTGNTNVAPAFKYAVTCSVVTKAYIAPPTPNGQPATSALQARFNTVCNSAMTVFWNGYGYRTARKFSTKFKVPIVDQLSSQTVGFGWTTLAHI